ncbi:GroES-like protein [Artomyces pyxidatus]|uniref:GroES-like protein n=1 Tax=Artomyces pyxidatus TaxID=48021 RepID=A0ACB8SP13_9AGAM|nr:GroES-like protein [Artomyces pyxidatus]
MSPAESFTAGERPVENVKPIQYSPLPVSCSAPHAPWKTIKVPMRTPAPHEVFIKVHASGICNSDHFVYDGAWPGISFPRTPGHEVVGRVVSIGEGVKEGRFSEGELVGVGWNGGYCGACTSCREGEFWDCEKHAVTGITHDGGHAEYIYAPVTSVVKLPEDALKNSSYAELAPLLCAGITVFGALASTSYSPGDICIVQGVGGLGHLAIQYATRMGLKVYATSSGPSKAELARSLGAHEHIDASAVDVAEYMSKLGGAKVVLCTAPSASAINKVLPAVARGGVVTVVGAASDGEIKVSTQLMNMKRATLRGWACGTSIDTEQCVHFSNLAHVKAMVKEYKLEDFAEAYENMIAGGPKFRNVIVFP